MCLSMAISLLHILSSTPLPSASICFTIPSTTTSFLLARSVHSFKMPSIIRSFALALAVAGFAVAIPAGSPTVTAAPSCTHDACSQAIAQQPHPKVCPAYLAAGPGVTPAPPTYTEYDGCGVSQIYSACTCFFSNETATSVPSSATTAPTTTVLPTTTSTSSSPSVTLSPESPSPCPYPNNSNVTTSAGNTYEVLCGWDVLYNDDPATCKSYLEHPVIRELNHDRCGNIR